jgi:hypothetical protein
MKWWSIPGDLSILTDHICSMKGDELQEYNTTGGSAPRPRSGSIIVIEDDESSIVDEAFHSVKSFQTHITFGPIARPFTPIFKVY